MKFFVEKRMCVDNADISFNGSYALMELKLDEETSFFIYVVADRIDRLYFIANLQNIIEPVMSIRAEDRGIFARTWPITDKGIQNGFNDDYRDYALVRASDFDDGSEAYFVIVKVEGVKIEDFYTSEQTQGAGAKVVCYAQTILNELSENKINYKKEVWGMFGKAFIKEMGNQIKDMTIELLPDIIRYYKN